MVRVSTLACALVLAAGCATRPEIAYDIDQNHDFSGYETFVWMGGEPLTVEGDPQAPESVLASLEQAVRDEMKAKGFKEAADASQAQFGVDVVVAVDETVDVDHVDETFYAPTDVSVRAVNRPGPRDGYFGSAQYEQVTIDSVTRLIDQGRMTIQVVDLASGETVWRANALKDVTHSARDGSAAIRGVRELLKDFPPE